MLERLKKEGEKRRVQGGEEGRGGLERLAELALQP